MYGLRYKYIRIDDPQFNFKMDKICFKQNKTIKEEINHSQLTAIG